MRLLGLSLFVVLAVASPAQAGWRTDRVTAITYEVWGDDLRSVCPGGFQIRYGTPPAPLDPDSLGWASELVCEVGLNAADPLMREWAAICTVVPHELGHVLQYGHDHIGHGGIMVPRRVGRDVGYRVIAGKSRWRSEVWFGVDRRCRERGRPYLKSRGLL